MSQWYAIRIVTQRAAKVEQSLAEAGFSAFTPHERVSRKLGRHLVVQDKPMFPGYLFVLCNDGEEHNDFAAVRAISGVVNFVTFMKDGAFSPIAFPLKAIIKIQAEERAGMYDRTRAKPNAYRPRKGERVQITAGPWISYIAKVLDTPRGKRAKVMIEGPYGRGETIEITHLKAA